jgi:[glutamine synthetase] adenylyltransferase / [glutamine synthetase]-adenylyl-L-tyrosine phosphorylase
VTDAVTVAVLARRGFVDATRAQAAMAGLDALSELSGAADLVVDIVDDLGACADPDQGLRLLVELTTKADEATRRRMAASFAADPDARRRLIDVLGMSEGLGEFLVRHPNRWEVLLDAKALAQAPARSSMRERMMRAIGADPLHSLPMASNPNEEATLDALRIAYRTELLGIAARDLVGVASMDEVGAWLADLADVVLEAALAIGRAAVPGAERMRLAVIAMGKAGGRELNYISDVDVIFVAEPGDGEQDETAALAIATSVATQLMRACSTATPEGAIWEVDPNLRPEGRQGALVRTLASHIGYYERWAKTWEFQALLKARHAAGDRELGDAYVNAVQPFVWSAADREGFVDDVQAMRRRVIDNVPARLATRELKLGPGGLRDVEFAVQLLQLVHGRSDVMLRSPTTLVALESLATWGYVGREDAATLAAAYRFLRTLEHRIQLHKLRRTHTMPEDEGDLRRLGRSLGMSGDPVAALVQEWKRHAREVRRIHEKLFYRPLLQAVARLDAGEARLSIVAAEERLRALGYVDPPGAIRHLEALTSGVSRRAAIQRTLLPVMLGWFADAPDPDAGLLGFRRVSDALGSTHWYLGLLRDESLAAERMARILASSRFVSDLLLRAPDSVALLAEDAELAPRSLEALLTEVDAVISRHADPALAVSAVRALRRRELFRISASQVIGLIDDVSARQALTHVARATIEGALQVAMREEAADLPLAMSIIAMGRFGGAELGLGSDVDVMFVYEARDGLDDETANRAAFAVAGSIRTLLMAPSADPNLEVDADLRPEGRNGPLVRSLESYRSYYERWSSPWEAQALLRAEPVAGDPELGRAFTALIDPIRYPAAGIGDAEVREIRRLKARMEGERLPRGADARLHVKLGRGGLSDVEWVVQLLQLQHGSEVQGLQTTRTLDGLRAATAAGLVAAGDAETLAAAWSFATRVRDAMMLATGRALDMLPADTKTLVGTAFLLDYPMTSSSQLIEDYLRVTRRARGVFDRLFYGIDDATES